MISITSVIGTAGLGWSGLRGRFVGETCVCWGIGWPYPEISIYFLNNLNKFKISTRITVKVGGCENINQRMLAFEQNARSRLQSLFNLCFHCWNTIFWLKTIKCPTKVFWLNFSSSGSMLELFYIVILVFTYHFLVCDWWEYHSWVLYFSEKKLNKYIVVRIESLSQKLTWEKFTKTQLSILLLAICEYRFLHVIFKLLRSAKHCALWKLYHGV